jgi:hypothetical protein
VIHDWPINSSDLNCFELFWIILKKIVSNFQPENIQQLKEVLLRAWESIPYVTINKLYLKFSMRFQVYFGDNCLTISNLLWTIREKEAF